MVTTVQCSNVYFATHSIQPRHNDYVCMCEHAHLIHEQSHLYIARYIFKTEKRESNIYKKQERNHQKKTQNKDMCDPMF